MDVRSMLLDGTLIFPFLASGFIITSYSWPMTQYQAISTQLDPLSCDLCPIVGHFDGSAQPFFFYLEKGRPKNLAI